MVSEHSLQRPGEELSQRIREQAEPAVRRFISELLTEADKERAGLPNSGEASSTVRDAWAESGLVRVLDGVRLLDQAGSLSAVLDTLAESAGAQAPRVAVLTVHDDRVRGWRFVGFGPDLSSARQVEKLCSEVGMVARAVNSGKSCSVVCGHDGMLGDVAPGFTTLPTGASALAVPVLVGCEVKTVVYADDVGGRSSSHWCAAVEILACYAGLCCEALTTARLGQLLELETVEIVKDKMNRDVSHDPQV